jgi:hypothetical protein
MKERWSVCKSTHRGLILVLALDNISKPRRSIGFKRIVHHSVDSILSGILNRFLKINGRAIQVGGRV